MTSALVLVLSLTGFGLLLLGERMGLAPGLAYAGVVAVALAAAVVLGIASMTSRIGRFMVGENRGGSSGLAALVAAVTVSAGSFGSVHGAPSGVAQREVLLGLLAAALLASFNPWRNFGPTAGAVAAASRKNIDPSPGTQGAIAVAMIASGLAALVLLVRDLPGVLDRAAEVSGLARDQVRFGALGFLLVVPVFGGMLGARRVAKLFFAIAVMTLILPVLAVGIGAAAGEAGIASAWAARVHEGTEQLRAIAAGWFSSRDPSPDWLAVGTGMTLGFLLLQPAAATTGQVRRVVATIAGLGFGVAIGLLLHLLQQQLADNVSQRLVAAAPSQWPLVVFDEALRGWLTVCGKSVPDAASAAQACGVSGARLVLPQGSLGFQQGLAMPATSLLLGWPVIIGFIWGLLPSLMGLAALGFLIVAGASAFSERVLFRWSHPRALRAWRLAMIRIVIVLIAAGLFELDRHAIRIDPAVLRWLLMGSAGTLAVALLAHWVVRFMRMTRRFRTSVALSPQDGAPDNAGTVSP